MQLFNKKPEITEKLEDSSIAIAEVLRQLKRLEMKVINVNKRIDRLENDFDQYLNEVSDEEPQDEDNT